MNTQNLCCSQQCGYNKYSSIRGMGYKIIEYLMLNDDEIWKLLAYDSPDALSQPSLTFAQKTALIYSGNDNTEKYRVFRQRFMDDAIDYQCSQLRVYLANVVPESRSFGTVDFAIEVACHNKLVNLDYGESRLEVMIQRVLEVLNGTSVGGVGLLAFNREVSRYDIISPNLYNNRNFYGYTIIMSVKVANVNC